MKQSLFVLLVLGLISVGCTSTNKAATPDTAAQPNSEASASSPSISADQDFVTKAAQGNAEVELGKIVAEKTKNPAAKQFAQMMVKEHTAALNELQELA